MESNSLLTRFLLRLWNRGLPPTVRITHQVAWPLFLLPFALFSQIVTPHPVWIVLTITLMGIYGFGYFWVRSQATQLNFRRKRVGLVLVAGDALREEFELQNDSILSVLWAELIDHSTLPGYTPGRVVACGSNAIYRWQTAVECPQRGIYRLGPHELTLGDPLGLFRLHLQYDYNEVILIYPRVAHLPSHLLPHGDTSGAARQRRPLRGVLPSASVRHYQSTDSLRYVHWPITAHAGQLMVKEMEIEPGGAVWLVLDLNAAMHSGKDEKSTLEFGVVLAASLAAELLLGGDRRAVGLLAVSGHDPTQLQLAPLTEFSNSQSEGLTRRDPQSSTFNPQSSQAVLVSPQLGQVQLWRILGALAAVQAADVGLADLLRSSGSKIGRRGTVIVITPQLHSMAGPDDWTVELLHLQAMGVASSVLLVAPAAGERADGSSGGNQNGASGEEVGAALNSVLARYDIPLQRWQAGERLPSALIFRRTRKVVRSTPTGGAVSYDVEEEV